MRKVREVLRLYHGAGLSIRAIARSLGVSPTTVGDYVRCAERQGLTWPLPGALDDAALQRRMLMSPMPPRGTPRPLPQWSEDPPRASSQGGDAHAAVARVQGDPSRGVAVQPVLRAVPGVCVDARRGDAPGAPCGREDVRGLRRTDRPGGGPRDRRGAPGAGLRRRARGVELYLRRGDLDADPSRTGRHRTFARSSSSGAVRSW